MTYADTITIDSLERDPYPIYARLRREEPLIPVPAANCWFATRWKDIEAINRSPDFTAASDDAPVNEAFGRPNVLTSEGPDHTALRTGIDAHYKPKKVAGYIEALVRPIAEAQLAAFRASDDNDLMSLYFEPISALSLARSFGLTEVDVATLRRWFHGLSQGAINFERDPARAADCARAVAEIEAILLPFLARLAQNPDGSPLSHLLHSGIEEGKTRAPEYILPTVKVTLLGGMQEPGHGAGSTLTGLLANPEQLQDLRQNLDTLLPQAIDEGLRWVAPIGTMMRTALRDTMVNDIPVPEGAAVSCIMASANRDEARFPEPDSFNIHRPQTAHMSFGAGAHFCAGKWFAKAQIEIALRVLFEACPDLRLAGAAPDFRGWEFRAPTSLRIVKPAS
ncbi:MAG: cytochrome P450 [Proteobacteria bacterium]|nr:cytochrome P450 [Pseudomonadota bacterium]